MRTYLISYDLAKPHLTKHVIAHAIMAVGESWARPLEQTWYVRSEASQEAIEIPHRPPPRGRTTASSSSA